MRVKACTHRQLEQPVQLIVLDIGDRLLARTEPVNALLREGVSRNIPAIPDMSSIHMFIYIEMLNIDDIHLYKCAAALSTKSTQPTRTFALPMFRHKPIMYNIGRCHIHPSYI